MKLKKFFKPLVTVSALSFMLMGCADDSSNSGGSTTPPPTAESVFTKFLTDFQAAPAKNAETPVEFTTNTATKPNLAVAKGEEVQYLVSLDNVMAVYYTMFGIEGTSTLLTDTGSGITAELTQIKNYAKVDTVSATTDVPLTLTNGTNSLYTGMFALMNEDNVTKLDTALKTLSDEVNAAKVEGNVDLTKIQVATVKNVVDLINGKMYKVAYNSPAQSIQDAFAAAQPLKLTPSMAFNEGDTQNTAEIAANGLSFVDSTPAIAADAVVVFLDEFKAQLEGVTDVAKVVGATDANNISNVNITSDTLENSANKGAITYTAASTGIANGSTYVAIVDATLWDQINTTTDGEAFYTLNTALGDAGATKAEVEAALELLSGKIYKIDYTVNTIQSLIDAFKASTEATTAVASATPQQNLTFTAGETYSDAQYLYCLYENKSIKLDTVAGVSASTDIITNYVNGNAGNSSASDQIVFIENAIDANGLYYAYCTTQQTQAYTAGETSVYLKLEAFLNKLKTDGMQVFAYEKTGL